MRSFIVRYRHVDHEGEATSPTYLGVIALDHGHVSLTAGRSSDNLSILNLLIAKLKHNFEEQVEQDEIEPEAVSVEVTGIGNLTNSTCDDDYLGHALMPVHAVSTVVKHYEPSGRWE